jgi:hypothetical protein
VSLLPPFETVMVLFALPSKQRSCHPKKSRQRAGGDTKREQAPALVRLKAHLVREVEVLFRYALSGL